MSFRSLKLFPLLRHPMHYLDIVVRMGQRNLRSLYVGERLKWAYICTYIQREMRERWALMSFWRMRVCLINNSFNCLVCLTVIQFNFLHSNTPTFTHQTLQRWHFEQEGLFWFNEFEHGFAIVCIINIWSYFINTVRKMGGVRFWCLVTK